MENENKVGRSDLFSKYIYIWDEWGDMAKKKESLIILNKRAIMGVSGTLT